MERWEDDRWADIHTFRYTGMRFDVATGVATFDYTMDGAQRHSFTDTITFPLPARPPVPETVATLHRVLELLYVAIGTIYYKSMTPKAVDLGAVRLSPAARRWAQQLYRKGLAEFAYRWTLPHVLDLELAGEPGDPVAHRRDLAQDDRRPLVAIGGGKDSLVSLEALQAAGYSPAVFVVERQPTPLLSEMMSLAGGPALRVSRTVDARLTGMIRDNTARIGHVPVTAINSLAGAAAAALHGLGPVVMSNERSADEANLAWRGRAVNHQWSKGLEAESLLRDALREHAGLDNACFSLLRGMSELRIAELFASTDRYDRAVTSCNHAFRMSHQARTERWCNDCAKCRFVFLAFAPFMGYNRLVGIFGADLLDDDRHTEGYRELLGLAGHKPFECVGEITESRVAAWLLSRDPTWRDTCVVRTLREELPEGPTEQQVAAVLAADPLRLVPTAYARAMSAMQAKAPAGCTPRGR